MKYVIVLFTIILVLVPVVFAEDDTWIDGIMYSAAIGWTTRPLEIHSKQHGAWEISILGITAAQVD